MMAKIYPNPNPVNVQAEMYDVVEKLNDIYIQIYLLRQTNGSDGDQICYDFYLAWLDNMWEQVDKAEHKIAEIDDILSKHNREYLEEHSRS